MARFGTWAPLSGTWAAQPKMTQVDIISLHTMVGGLAGTDAMFRSNGYGGTFSHFGVGGNGECTQWQDTAYRAAANYNGNWHIVSVECADMGAPFAAWNTSDGSAVPAFTVAQCETLAQLIATMCRAHNIPCEIISDAKPGRRGIGWHRMGVPGYMVAGAEQWSTVNKKACPGDRRIAQIPGIVARAQQLLAGNPPEEDMPLTVDDLKAIKEYVWRDPLPENQGVAILTLNNIQAQVGALVASMHAVADAVKASGGTGFTLDQAIAAGQAGADAALKQLGQQLAS